MSEFRGRITIDGRGTFDYVLTKVENGSPAVAIPIPPNSQRPVSVPDGDVVTVTLLKHEMKSGMGKNEKPYEKHVFRASDNRSYTTFRSEIVAQLSPLVGQGTPVKLVAKANDFKGFDIQRVLGS
jgi:hypothetical protein